MKYHCPECKAELQKGRYSAAVRWLIGPLFGQFLRPLICNEHGEIKIYKLSPEEMKSAKSKRMIGIIGGTLANIVVLILIIFLTFNS